MNNTIYWAVKLDAESKAILLANFLPVHPNVYAEHMTIVFRPSDEVDKKVSARCGRRVTLKVIGYAEDIKGQAIVVESKETISETGHITISCANGTKPVYSNEMIKNSWSPITNQIILQGVILRFTSRGWEKLK